MDLDGLARARGFKRVGITEAEPFLVGRFGNPIRMPLAPTDMAAETTSSEISNHTGLVEIPSQFDVIIIGGGPAGASAAIYTSRSELSTLVIDKGLTVGALGLTSKIANYPGVRGPIGGAELLSVMREQAESFGARFLTDRVVGMDISREQKTVFTNGGSYQGSVVILATGAMGRAATIPGEERLVGKGVSYCATCDGAFFKGLPVAVVGNNDEALEEALFLTKFASVVHLLVQTTAYKASVGLVRAVEKATNVRLHFATRLVRIEGDKSVSKIRVVNRADVEEDLDVNGVFVYLQGNRPVTEYLMGQVELTPAGCLRVDSEMQSSIPGVFAVGDLLCTHPKQAIIAAADGVVAAIAAEKFVHQRSKARVDWG